MQAKRSIPRTRKLHSQWMIAAAALCGLLAPCDRSAALAATYDIPWHAVSNGVRDSRGGCFAMSGTIGEPASGYAIGATYALISGYFAAAPTSGRDAIFHNGFEGC